MIKKLYNPLLETVDLIRKLSSMKPTNPADILALSLSQKSLKLIDKLTKIQELIIITDIQKNNKEHKDEIQERFDETLKLFEVVKKDINDFEIEYEIKIKERDERVSIVYNA